MPSQFFCQACGNEFPRWSGQCPACGEWNTLVEEKITKNKSQITNKPQSFKSQTSKPQSITKVETKIEDRRATGLRELDRVLGGGIVGGSVVLLAGEPGIGKSTLMLQLAEALAKKEKVLYVSGEESPQQISLRARRLGTISEKLLVFPETDLFLIEKSIADSQPSFVVIDSIQTISRDDVAASASSVSQVKECAAYLVKIAKATGTPIFIVGHITKEGSIAGPKILEHIVDTVLNFEGEEHKQYRLLRATKNRFGSTNEVGIFQMTEKGLIEVANPSELFLSEKPEGAPGSVVTATIEGSRPLLVEVQALVAPTKMAYPSRKATGVDPGRLAVVIAVLERHLGLKLSIMDIFVNVAGGVRVAEPAADLAIALAIISAYQNKAIDPKTLAIGEVGLAGEIRSVDQAERRVREAEKLGFETVYLPKGNLKEVKKSRIKCEALGLLKEVTKV